jgi:hypothetical protein
MIISFYDSLQNSKKQNAKTQISFKDQYPKDQTRVWSLGYWYLFEICLWVLEIYHIYTISQYCSMETVHRIYGLPHHL